MQATGHDGNCSYMKFQSKILGLLRKTCFIINLLLLAHAWDWFTTISLYKRFLQYSRQQIYCRCKLWQMAIGNGKVCDLKKQQPKYPKLRMSWNVCDVEDLYLYLCLVLLSLVRILNEICSLLIVNWNCVLYTPRKNKEDRLKISIPLIKKLVNSHQLNFHHHVAIWLSTMQIIH